MDKQEAALKSKLTVALKQYAPDLLILAYATAGAPDREIVGAGLTTRWECKHATPSFDSPGQQELMCMRLARAGHCRYIIWWERSDLKKTFILHPCDVFKYRTDISYATPEAWCLGHDMKWLVQQIRKAHGQKA